MTEPNEGFMKVTVDLGVNNFGCLLLNGFDYLGMAVTGIGYPNPAGEI
jgi:hypothetical protein